MTDNLVQRLRDWEHVYPEDQDKTEGHLYEEAADRIEELEAEVERVKVLEDVLREIANGAFNDNGDVTMDHGHMIRAFFKARAALAKAKGDE